MAATGGSCRYRKSVCFAPLFIGVQCLVVVFRMVMDEEKKELKLFFAFIHPNQWYGAEPPFGSCATYPCGGQVR